MYNSHSNKDIIYLVYLWMSFAMIITGIVAYLGAYVSPFADLIVSYNYLIFGISIITQLILIIFMSLFMQNISFFSAFILFFLFAFSMGINFSSIFQMYSLSSIVYTFFIAFLMFIVMSIYGYITKVNLSKISSILQMTLLGIVISIFLNLFLRNSLLDFIISIVGVCLFSILTALNMQEIKNLSKSHYSLNSQDKYKITLLSAISIYLNLINLFLSLLGLQRNKDENN